MLELNTFSNWWNKFLWGAVQPIQPVEETQTVTTEEEKQEMKSYFTIEELCASQVAKNLHIDNTPPANIVENLKRLIEFLNPLREAWGSPIRINSGFRCDRLNTAVKGVNNSAHLTGNAVDMTPVNKKQTEFENFVVNYLKNHDLKWDQCLKEKSKTDQWLHLGLYDNTGKQRCQIKNLYV